MQPGTFNTEDLKKKKKPIKLELYYKGQKGNWSEREVCNAMFFLGQNGHAPAVVVFVRKQ